MSELYHSLLGMLALGVNVLGWSWLALRLAHNHWELDAHRRADDLLDKGMYPLLRHLPLKRDTEYEDNHFRKYRWYHKGMNGYLVELFFDQDSVNGDSISVWKNGKLCLSLHENIGEFHVEQMDYVHTILEAKDPEW